MYVCMCDSCIIYMYNKSVYVCVCVCTAGPNQTCRSTEGTRTSGSTFMVVLAIYLESTKLCKICVNRSDESEHAKIGRLGGGRRNPT